MKVSITTSTCQVDLSDLPDWVKMEEDARRLLGELLDDPYIEFSAADNEALIPILKEFISYAECI